MPVVIPASTPGVELESLTLDGLELNSDTYWMESLSMPVPASLAEWIKGADSNGAILAREPLHENRVIEARLRVAPQATHDAVVAHIGSVLDKLQEAGRNTNGLPLVWDPANSTVDPITFRCLMGEIIDLPIDWESGRFVNAWAFTIRLTCLPFGEGEEYQVAAVTSSAPIIPLELEDIPGDVPALGRLVVTDAASQSRRYVAWGLESRHYDDTTSLVIDSADMVTTGYTGVTTAAASAYGGQSIFAILRQQEQAICGLGNLPHVGSFRPQLRVYVSSATAASDSAIRLTYKALDGPMRSLPYKLPAAIGWNQIDLGLITIPEATSGLQRWTGTIEAYAPRFPGAQGIYLDAIWLMPAEQFGRARASYAYRPGVMTSYDDFAGITAGTALNSRVAPVGGTWATTGATTDFAAGDIGTAETEVRSTASDTGTGRLAVLGSTNRTDVEAGVDVWWGYTYVSGSYVNLSLGVIARYVDANNYLQARLTVDPIVRLVVTKVVAGVATDIASPLYTGGATQTWFGVRLVAFASGSGIAQVLYQGQARATLSFADPDLATGGVLATGLAGFADRNTSAIAGVGRNYDNFYTAAPSPEPIVCHPSESITFASDGVLREDATGTYAGTPPEYVGGYPTIPNAGGPGRKTRLAVIARSNDVTVAADDTVTANAMQSTIVTAFATPQYLAIPRG